MSFASTPNRRKRWYHLLTIGQKKLMIICTAMGLLLLAILSVLGVYGYRAMQYDLSLVGKGLNSSVLFDSSNRPIAALADDSDAFVSGDMLPKHLVDAFVAREDETFFEHDGIVLTSVLRSVIRNIMSMRYEQGASTITMQLTRNVFELSGKSMDRKMLEAMLALRIEQNFDKMTILEQYLSRIYYGQNCYGIKAAARHYFGKSVQELNLVESATLAGLVRAPSLYNPVRSMSKARVVKAETLQRMLECGMISQEQCNDATAAPIVLNRVSAATESGSSYAVMWSRRELEELGSEIPEHAGGVSVVSSLNLNIQQYVEQSVEKALTAVEQPLLYPDAWVAGMTPEMAEAERKAFAKLKRPEALKVRGENNDLKDLLQCCVLVVDSRRNHRGRILAMVGGRSAVDGIDRWNGTIRPGRASAPFLFCCACMPGEGNTHIVARSAEMTGRRMGYDVVRAFYDSLNLPVEYPSREQELYLYNGLFQIRRVDLARLLFSLQNEGRGYRLSMVNHIWNSNQQMIYQYEPEKSPEYIRREGATAVSLLPPFRVTEGEPITMNESLPEGSGQWSMIFRKSSVCVFVWMGFDDASLPVASDRDLRVLLTRASSKLAREIYDKSRAELKDKQKAVAQSQDSAS